MWAGSAPITYHYQWERCSSLTAVCEAISGATAATYTLEAVDVASSMIVKVLASNSVGSASASSPETTVVGALLPVNLGLPSILGSLLEGQLLSAVPGSWSGTEPISYAYQWLACNAAGESCSEIPGATAPTLKLLSGLIGETVQVVVTATNAGGSTSATSSPTSLVQGLLPSNTGCPVDPREPSRRPAPERDDGVVVGDANRSATAISGCSATPRAKNALKSRKPRVRHCHWCRG